MAGAHQRNVGPMQVSPRCGAKTRAGTPCQAPRIVGAMRCRMHGGKGSGAPKGNRNALKTGLHTGVMLARAAEVRLLVRRAQVLIATIEAEQKLEKDLEPAYSALSENNIA